PRTRGPAPDPPRQRPRRQGPPPQPRHQHPPPGRPRQHRCRPALPRPATRSAPTDPREVLTCCAEAPGRETGDMKCSDWGERSPRWAGVRSQAVEVCGSSVHSLTADATRPGAPTHLLIHSTLGSATNWLDTIRPLTACGRVIAPDLPGTLAGHTASPHRSAARAQINARVLRAFPATLGLAAVVARGWSLGGLVALLFADLAPERVGGLVLVAPTLPGPLSAAQELGWQTLGRLTVATGSPVLRGLLRLTGRRLLELKKRRYNLAAYGGDPSR